MIYVLRSVHKPKNLAIVFFSNVLVLFVTVIFDRFFFYSAVVYIYNIGPVYIYTVYIQMYSRV